MWIAKWDAIALMCLVVAACSSTTTEVGTPPTPITLTNASPLCGGVKLNPNWQRQYLGIYTWRLQESIYVPVEAGLSGAAAVSAQLTLLQADDPHLYAVTIGFSGHDADMLHRITQQLAGSSSQPAEPTAHMGLFVGLTTDDIEGWSSRQAILMRPLNSGGKLLSNPVFIEPVTSGQLLITVSDLSVACSLTAATLPSH